MIRFALGCVAILTVAALAGSALLVASLPPTTIDFMLWSIEIIVRICIATPVLVAIVAGLLLFQRWRQRERTMIDGAWQMQRYRVRVWRNDLPWPLATWEYMRGYRGELDRNRIVAPAWYLRSDGVVVEQAPAAGWGLQHQYNLAVESTNHIRAALPGDAVRNTIWGRDSEMPRLPARALNGRQERPQLMAPVDNDEVEGEFTPIAIPFGEAVRSNSPTAFALGQSPNGIVRWDVEQAPHIRVHGQTQGSGKTNVIKTIIAGAIPQGVHVIVLDRRGFKDWSDYRRHVEFIDNRKPGMFACTLHQLCEIYRKRDILLGRHGASNLAELPNAPARLFVVVSEFGTVCREAAVTGEMDEALPVLKSIMSEAGATGVHLIFEDQVVNRNWPRELRGNADPITGYLPEDTAAAGGYRRAFDLATHEFHYDGQRFKTWDMKIEAPRLLTATPPNGECVIDIRSVVRRSVENNNSTPKPQKPTENNNRTEHRTPNAELRKMVWTWRDAHPNGTQAELRKSFEDDGIEIARGYVHECWHKWPGTQPATVADQLQALGYSLNDVRLPSGDKLGIDSTHGG